MRFSVPEQREVACDALSPSGKDEAGGDGK